MNTEAILNLIAEQRQQIIDLNEKLKAEKERVEQFRKWWSDEMQVTQRLTNELNGLKGMNVVEEDVKGLSDAEGN